MPSDRPTTEGRTRSADYPAPTLDDADLAEGFADVESFLREQLSGAMSQTRLYELLRSGQLASLRVGRRRLIPVARGKRDLVRIATQVAG